MSDLLSTEGRVGRLRFLVTNLVLGIALFLFIILAVASGAGAVMMAPAQGGGILLIGAIIGGAVLVGFLWVGMALVIRRLRDIGLSPWPIAISFTLFSAADASVAALTDTYFIAPFHYSTPLGGLVSIVVWSALLLWPSLPGAGLDLDDGEVLDLEVAEEMRTPPGPRPAASPVTVPRPVAKRALAPNGLPQFGRRT